MNKDEAVKLIANGEGLNVEFKKSSAEITKDVYETVCAFSNRNGGHIFLGVNDNGEIIGIDNKHIDKMKRDFVNCVNNPEKIYPPLYLQPQDILIDGKHILYIYVQEGSQVCRARGRIYDRNHEADIDITNNSDLVYSLYARKSNSYFVNKITGFDMSDLRVDVMEKARIMSRIRNINHPWLKMSDEEFLRSAGLIAKEFETRKEGLTLAAILLFGTDSAIMSVLPHHKTDAILRIENLDRYDDRDVIITNLFDTYDRLMAFAQKHLSDTFALEGINSVGVRDKILREIFSNSLAHRDYSNAYVAKFVIENDKFYTENANRAHGFGLLNLKTFQPYPKNPLISKIFRETGLADELGSGMRNTYKYTEIYSDSVPEFIEGDVFKTIVPIRTMAIAKIKIGEQVSDQVSEQVSEQVSDQVKRILLYCIEPKTKREICGHFGYSSQTFFTKKYLRQLLDDGLLKMTIPEKPNSRNQKYQTVKKI
mgnify:CR=1 FL=1